MLKPELKITTELFPNLVLHIMSCAGIGTESDEEYSKKFKKTLTPNQRSTIANLRNEFTRTPPAETTPLYQFLFHTPCYFPAENINAILPIYDLVKESIKESSFAPFEDSYPLEVKMIYKSFPHKFEGFIFADSRCKINDINKGIDIFKNVLAAGYTRFYADYWQEVRAKTQPVVNKIYEKINNINLIEEWNNITGLRFPYPHFHAILCEPTKSLATSLQAEKVIFSSRRKIDEIVDMIIHEIGTHIFCQKALFEIKRLRKAFFKHPNGLVRIIEVASEYLRKPISNKLGIDSKLSVAQFLKAENEYKIFQQIYEGGNYEDIYEAIFSAYNESKQKKDQKYVQP